ncbi:MAG TPA: hypothetical protein VNF68_04170, partial [Candidatus Baltobacteraceae bacterium]|nr:hypothetical protein [Candidatus Baltobacteraceae bacterium]
MLPRVRRVACFITLTLLAVAGCAGGSSAASPSASGKLTPTPTVAAGCSGAVVSSATNGLTPTIPSLAVPTGLAIQTIARVGAARELVALPNGDLLVGTTGPDVYIVPNAESAGTAGAPHVFASIANGNAAGIAFSQPTCTVYVATEYHIWSTPYRDGDLTAENLQPIASVRTGPTANPGDGDLHSTTSVAVSGSTLYA